MTRVMFPQQPWLAPLAGTLLIVLGGLQLIYATLWFLFALAAGFLGAVIDVGVTVVTTDPRGPSAVLPSENRFASEVDLGAYLATLGLGLAVLAVISGVLLLRNRRFAAYTLAACVVVIALLGHVHYLQAWIEMVVIYSICGVCLALLAVVVWLSPRLREAQDAVEVAHRQASS